MTFAEFTAVVDRRVAWRVLLKVAFTVFGGCATLVTIALGPVLWVYGNINGNVKDVARLEAQVNGLTSTVGALQLTVAGVVSEVKTSRSEQSRDLADIRDGIKALQQQRAVVPAARTANVPTRRATQ